MPKRMTRTSLLKAEFINLLHGELAFLPARIKVLEKADVNPWIDLFPDISKNFELDCYSLLYMACKNEVREEVIRYLIEYCPEMYLQQFLDGNEKGVPLVVTESESIFDLLLKNGASYTASQQGQTILHWASSNSKCYFKIPKLIEKGVNPNEYNEGGYTALHIACKKGQIFHVQFLLKGGADPAVKTKENYNLLAVIASEFQKLPIPYLNEMFIIGTRSDIKSIVEHDVKIAKIIKLLYRYYPNFWEMSILEPYSASSTQLPLHSLCYYAAKTTIQCLGACISYSTFKKALNVAYQANNRTYNSFELASSNIYKLKRLKQIVGVGVCQIIYYDFTTDLLSILSAVKKRQLVLDELSTILFSANENIHTLDVHNSYRYESLINKIDKKSLYSQVVRDIIVKKWVDDCLSCYKLNRAIELFISIKDYDIQQAVKIIKQLLVAKTPVDVFKDEFQTNLFIALLLRSIPHKDLKVDLKRVQEIEEAYDYYLNNDNKNFLKLKLFLQAAQLKAKIKYQINDQFKLFLLYEFDLNQAEEAQKYLPKGYNIFHCLASEGTAHQLNDFLSKNSAIELYTKFLDYKESSLKIDEDKILMGSTIFYELINDRLIIFKFHTYFVKYLVKTLEGFESRLSQFALLLYTICHSFEKKNVEEILTNIDNTFNNASFFKMNDFTFNDYCKNVSKLLHNKNLSYVKQLVAEYLNYINQSIFKDNSEKRTVNLIKYKLTVSGFKRSENKVTEDYAVLIPEVENNENRVKQDVSNSFLKLLFEDSPCNDFTHFSLIDNVSISDKTSSSFELYHNLKLEFSFLLMNSLPEYVKSAIEVLHSKNINIWNEEFPDLSLYKSSLIKLYSADYKQDKLINFLTRIHLEKSDITIFKICLKKFFIQINVNSILGDLFYLACQKNNYNLVKLLLNYGMDTNYQVSSSNLSFFAIASLKLNYGICKLILKKNPQVSLYLFNNKDILSEVFFTHYPSILKNKESLENRLKKLIKLFFIYRKKDLNNYYRLSLTSSNAIPNIFLLCDAPLSEAFIELCFYIEIDILELFLAKKSKSTFDLAQIILFAKQKDKFLQQLENKTFTDEELHNVLLLIAKMKLEKNPFVYKLEKIVILKWLKYYLKFDQLNEAVKLLLPYKKEMPKAWKKLKNIIDKSSYDKSELCKNIKKYESQIIEQFKDKQLKFSWQIGCPKAGIKLYLYNNESSFYLPCGITVNYLLHAIAKYGDREDLEKYCETLTAEQLTNYLQWKKTIEKRTLFDVCMTPHEIVKKYNADLAISFQGIIDKRLCVFNIHRYFCQYGWQALKGFKIRLEHFAKLLSVFLENDNLTNIKENLKITISQIEKDSSYNIDLLDKTFLEKCKQLILYDNDYIIKRIEEYILYLLEYKDNIYSKEHTVVKQLKLLLNTGFNKKNMSHISALSSR